MAERTQSNNTIYFGSVADAERACFDISAPRTFGDALLEGYERALRFSGVYHANLGCQPMRSQAMLNNCRNCGAPPELNHPHACGWCLSPR